MLDPNQSQKKQKKKGPRLLAIDYAKVMHFGVFMKLA